MSERRMTWLLLICWLLLCFVVLFQASQHEAKAAQRLEDPPTADTVLWGVPDHPLSAVVRP